MKKSIYTVVYKLSHNKNTKKRNKQLHVSQIKASSFSKVEFIIKSTWGKLDCHAEIIQIAKL